MKVYKHSQKEKKLWLLLFIVFLGILSISIVMMGISDHLKSLADVVGYAAGVLFWIGLIGIGLMILRINTARRKDRGFRRRSSTERRFGLISFFSNRYAFAADIAMFAFIAAAIVTKILCKNNIPFFIILALLVYSFGMHCMLNGTNYKYIKYKVGRVRK